MAVPDSKEMIQPLLLAAANAPINMAEAAKLVADQLGLTEDQREERYEQSGYPILPMRLHTVKEKLLASGLLERHGVGRGSRISTTEKGKLAASGGKPAIGKAAEASPDHSSLAPPEEKIEAAVGEIRDRISVDVLDAVLAKSPAFFEQVIIDVLLAMKYGGGRREMAEALGKSGDEGVDGIIKEDVLGLDAVYIQAKRYAPENKISRDALQAFTGALVQKGATKGVFVTTSSFQESAKAYVKEIRGYKIVLIDGKKLAELMVSYNVGIKIDRTIEIKAINEDYFDRE